MSGFLLDTNVVSELAKDAPDSRVIAFLRDQDDLWLSAIVLHELDFGLNLLPLGQRRERLQQTIAAFVAEYDDRILPLGRMEARWAALARVQSRQSGRTLELGDALIAGTAMVHDLAVVTRNVRDFYSLSVEIVNPWEL